MSNTNRNYKASVFSHLFGDPDKERGLYNAFSPVELPLESTIIDYTLTDALYKERINDLAFTVGRELVCFFEGQSSINENMALRYLLFCGRVYEKLIDNKAIYCEKRFEIPKPVFYVLYNGIKPFPEKRIYRLSDSFTSISDGVQSLELTVTAYNINIGYNEDIVKKDANLSGYVTLVAKVRENEKNGMERELAVKIAIERCIKDGVLAEYLERNASEVINMLFSEWNWDEARAVWVEEVKIEEREKWESIISDKDKALTDKDKALAENKETIADKDKVLADKDKVLADKDAEIAALKAQLDHKVGGK